MRGAKLLKIIAVGMIVPQVAVMLAALYFSSFCDYVPWEYCTSMGLQLLDAGILPALIQAGSIFSPIFIGGQTAQPLGFCKEHAILHAKQSHGVRSTRLDQQVRIFAIVIED